MIRWLEQAERFGARDRVRSRGYVQLAVQLAGVGLDGVQRDVELLADLTSGETAREASQHRELGRAGFLDDVAVSDIRSRGGEVLLDGGRNRG